MNALVNDECKLDSLSPLDGRYITQTAILRPIFSERGLILYRIKAEVLYLEKLVKTLYPDIHSDAIVYPEIQKRLRFLYNDLNFKVNRVKEIEETIKHDVKSVEYYIKEELDNVTKDIPNSKTIVNKIKPLVHFGLTSQDITTISLWMQLKDAKGIYDQYTNDIEDKLRSIFSAFSMVPMLSRTHGQAATPTLLGKEFMVFAERLHRQKKQLNLLFEDIHIKFGGAIGNLNAHYYVYGSIDWMKWCDEFIESFGFKRSQFTTQIDHYDSMGSIFDNLKRINIILIDLCRDIWDYISRDYLKLSINSNEVGSSTMPHKVNPINFENAEGNLYLANALFETFSRKLPVSRMQRDLTDSTVTRNFGVAFGYTFVSLDNILKGMTKISPNVKMLHQDLKDNHIVIAEGIQSLLKKEGVEEGYEMLKELTRTNEKPSESDFKKFVYSLEISTFTKEKMLSLTPHSYTGKCPKDYK